jgi:predicted transcriptional regulator
MTTSPVDASHPEELPSDYPMAATSLKLPDSLKKRLVRLAAGAGQTPHAFMVEALAREADRAERRAEFAEHAAASEREAMDSGKTHALETAFDYLEAKAAGKTVRRPRARSWRASK